MNGRVIENWAAEVGVLGMLVAHALGVLGVLGLPCVPSALGVLGVVSHHQSLLLVLV